jgi:hypothetical protein
MQEDTLEALATEIAEKSARGEIRSAAALCAAWRDSLVREGIVVDDGTLAVDHEFVHAMQVVATCVGKGPDGRAAVFSVSISDLWVEEEWRRS